jgi:hypothetical protein
MVKEHTIKPTEIISCNITTLTIHVVVVSCGSGLSGLQCPCTTSSSSAMNTLHTMVFDSDQTVSNTTKADHQLCQQLQECRDGQGYMCPLSCCLCLFLPVCIIFFSSKIAIGLLFFNWSNPLPTLSLCTVTCPSLLHMHTCMSVPKQREVRTKSNQTLLQKMMEAFRKLLVWYTKWSGLPP